MNKIENIQKVFIVVRRKAKRVIPERISCYDYGGCDFLAVFPNKKHAQFFVSYFENGENVYDILERKLG